MVQLWQLFQRIQTQIIIMKKRTTTVEGRPTKSPSNRVYRGGITPRDVERGYTDRDAFSAGVVVASIVIAFVLIIVGAFAV